MNKLRTTSGTVQLTAGLLCLMLVFARFPAYSQTTYVAYGDSITSGTGDSAPEGQQAGYPVRLEALLTNATVINRGQPGGTTTELLIDFGRLVLEEADALLLMAGTNDVTRFARQSADAIGIEDTVANLRRIAQRAMTFNGATTLYSTIIPRPPHARWDPYNEVTQRLNSEIRHLAGTSGRTLVDVNERFREEPRRYALYYAVRPDDFVGHPNPIGYDQIAETFANAINSVDSSAPVVGIVSPYDLQKRVDRGARVQVDLWDFGSGIDTSTVELTVNGTVTGVTPVVSGKRVSLNYTAPSRFLGQVTVSAKASDNSTPPLTLDRQIITFFTKQTTFPDGDVNRDGRVDGKDLLILATAFGVDETSFKWDPDADFDQDGDVDGVDLAVLVDNFGTSL